ncbi:MAG: glycosyltransferase [Planctomycetota bacterium]|nr:glycosyltransferase [Planctomycetota bacterium]
MNRRITNLLPLDQRGPLRVMFLINDLSVGGAEMLLFNLMQQIDKRRIEPELGCMGAAGELGLQLADRFPVHTHLLKHKYDFLVIGRLKRLLQQRKIDAVVTVGAGDRMFWGRLAAWRAGVPVIISALHSTGWPDVVGRLNRALTPLNDAFIGVAKPHAQYLIDVDGFPADRVYVIPNGVDTQRYRPLPADASHAVRALRSELGLPATAPLIGIVAVLRPEKNHELLLQAATIVLKRQPDAQFLIIGNGPRRDELEQLTDELNIRHAVHFLGARSDVPRLLPLLTVFALTSKMEANPVSILEAQSCGVPVVATNVGSIAETVLDGVTGYLAIPGDANDIAAKFLQIIQHPERQQRMSEAARQNVVEHWSLDRMVEGYEELIECLYAQKVAPRNEGRGATSSKYAAEPAVADESELVAHS